MTGTRVQCSAGDRISLVVDDVAAIAERCWDAGFEVRVCGDTDDSTIVIIDAFDVEVELMARERYDVA